VCIIPNILKLSLFLQLGSMSSNYFMIIDWNIVVVKIILWMVATQSV